MTKTRKQRRHNPVARALSSAVCRPQVVQSKKAYRRRDKHKVQACGD
jgi:hypothetical protein